MGLHPCKPAGLAEYAGFAQTIDDRISCQCVSCYPDIHGKGLFLRMVFPIAGVVSGGLGDDWGCAK